MKNEQVVGLKYCYEEKELNHSVSLQKPEPDSGCGGYNKAGDQKHWAQMN